MKGFEGIRVNNLGFFPGAKKVFSVLNPPSMDFQVQTIGTDVRWKTVFLGTLKMGEGGIATGDISAIVEPADYRILIGDPDTEQHLYSEPFVVKDEVYDPAMRMILTGVRWQRCGSPEGWGGCCHQDNVPLKHGTEDTGVRLDVRGGYHQSGDLRCWADGISGSFLAFLWTFPLLQQVWADKTQLDDELAWCAAYFLKIVRMDGMVYDCQFVPIGWGPRDYYDSPAPLTAHCNIGRFLAGTYLHFKDSRPTFAEKCLTAALKISDFVEDSMHFTVPYVPPVPDLPPGTQGANFYFQDYRTSARGLAARCSLALAMFRATGDCKFRLYAEGLSQIIAPLQIADGPSAGLFYEAKDKETLGFAGCSYGQILSGPYVFIDLLKALPDSLLAHQWKTIVERYANLLLRIFRGAGRRYIPAIDLAKSSVKNLVIAEHTAASLGVSEALFMLDSGIFPDEAQEHAQFVLDYCLGENPRGLSYVNGIGWRHASANVWGQFFPSTPPIPGGVTHILGGEYDMPAAAMLFLLMAEMSRKNRK